MVNPRLLEAPALHPTQARVGTVRLGDPQIPHHLSRRQLGTPNPALTGPRSPKPIILLLPWFRAAPSLQALRLERLRGACVRSSLRKLKGSHHSRVTCVEGTIATCGWARQKRCAEDTGRSGTGSTWLEGEGYTKPPTEDSLTTHGYHRETF